MKPFNGLSIVLSGCGLSVSAHAQTAAFSPWNTAYLGAEIGRAFGSSEKDFSNGNTTGSFDTNDVACGAVFGVSRAWDALVLGLKATTDGSSLTGDTHRPEPRFTYKTDSRWDFTLRQRLGYAFGSILPYLTGGLAVGDIRVLSFLTASGKDGVDDNRVEAGWTAGAGLELALDPNWSINGEYRYIPLGDAAAPSDVGKSTRTTLDANAVAVETAFHFRQFHAGRPSNRPLLAGLPERDLDAARLALVHKFADVGELVAIASVAHMAAARRSLTVERDRAVGAGAGGEGERRIRILARQTQVAGEMAQMQGDPGTFDLDGARLDHPAGAGGVQVPG